MSIAFRIRQRNGTYQVISQDLYSTFVESEYTTREEAERELTALAEQYSQFYKAARLADTENRVEQALGHQTIRGW